MTPDVSFIKKICSVLKTVVKRLNKDHDFTPLLARKVEAWIEIAASAMALIGGNVKMRDEEQSSQKSDVQVQDALLRAVVAARAKVTSNMQSMKDLEEQDLVKGLLAMEPGSSTQEQLDLVALFQMEIPPALVSELENENFDSIVIDRCGNYGVNLTKAAQEAADHCNGVGNHGDSNWKSAIPENANFQDILAIAESTVLKAPGKQLKTLTEKYIEVLLSKLVVWTRDFLVALSC